ncbi:MAG TPA: prolyl oligopeptidase family serine peptidase, partial [Candidatus Angelobacter sp.]|nr:prolyl oligopeptidase family serine peptidase [Candidatus Angelobacter sp.]
DVATERVRYVAPSVDRDFAPRWSPDGKQIVFIRAPGSRNYLPVIPQRPQPWAIWLADAVTAEARELWHSGKGLNDSLPPFAAKSLKFGVNERIVLASEMDGRNHLYVVGAYSHIDEQPVLLTPGDFDVEDVTLSPDGTTVVYTSNEGDVDRRHIWAASLSHGQDSARKWNPMPQTALTQGATIEWNPLMLSDNMRVVCFGSTATSPAMPYYLTGAWPTNVVGARVISNKERVMPYHTGELPLVAFKGRQMIAPNALPSDFPSDKLVEPQQVTFRSDDGLEIHGQLFVSKRRPASGRGPALIFAHGGPPRQMMLGFHYMYYYHNSYAENQYLASLGYVVLSVNYRLGSMYGRAFREAPNSGWRGSFEYKDVLAGAKYLQSLPYVDSKRIGIWGGSYGGLMTALALSRNSDVFAAGVDFHGVHDWSVFLRRSAPDTAPDYKEALKLAYDSSPIASVATWKSPVLLMHGDDDRNVAFQQTTDLVQRLRENHVPFEEIIFPDEIHDFLLWKTWIRGYKATAEFFDRKFF